MLGLAKTQETRSGYKRKAKAALPNRDAKKRAGPKTSPGKVFGRGCLKGLLHMLSAPIRRKCEKIGQCCKMCN